MEKLQKKMVGLWKEEEGATMVEYGLMVALIAVVCIGIITTLGTGLRDGTFTPVEQAVSGT